MIRLLQGLLYTAHAQKKIQKILVVRKGNIGDHICALPALYALKKHFAQAELHCLTSSGEYRELNITSITGPQFFKTVTEFDDQGRAALLKQIRSANYDLVVELPQYLDTLYTQLRNLVFFRWAGIRSGFGWQVSNLFMFRKAQLQHHHFEREPQRLLSILKANGIDGDETYNPALSTDGIPPGLLMQSNMVVVAVGAKEPRKRWPLQNFKTVVDELVRWGYTVCLLGNKSDAQEVQTWVSDQVVNLCGALSPAASMQLIKQSRLAITNDSGPMHMSYAVGTPLVVTFSARDYPGKWFPPASGKTVLLHHYEVPCAVCVAHHCTENICLQQIKPAEVLGHARRLLAEAAPVQV